MMLAIEEHGGGRQLARVKMWPRLARVAGAIALASLLLAAGALASAEYVAAVIFAGLFSGVTIRALQECAATMNDVADTICSADVVSLNRIGEHEAATSDAPGVSSEPLSPGREIPPVPDDYQAWRPRRRTLASAREA